MYATLAARPYRAVQLVETKVTAEQAIQLAVLTGGVPGWAPGSAHAGGVWSHRVVGRCAGPDGRKGGGWMSQEQGRDGGLPGEGAGRSSGRGGRRRRANAKGGRHHRHEVKVTPEEEARLLLVAQSLGVTVSRLLVESALAGERGETATERARLLTELFAVHRTLAGVANNVNQIAKKLHGTGELAVESGVVLGEARAVMARIDALIDGLAL